MTIQDLRAQTAALAAATAEHLKAASVELHRRDYRPHDDDWRDAWAKLTSWADVRNGFRMVEDALHGLELIEKGGDWS